MLDDFAFNFCLFENYLVPVWIIIKIYICILIKELHRFILTNDLYFAVHLIVTNKCMIIIIN